MTKSPADPRLLRLRALYRDLDGIPERRKKFAEACKQEQTRLLEQIERAWAELLGDVPVQTPSTFPVHHGDRLIGHSRQPKRTGT